MLSAGWAERFRWKPRLVWLLMHTGALTLLELAGGWPGSTRAYGALLLVTASLYLATSFSDPGYITAAEPQGRSRLAALGVALLELPVCTYCDAPQPARTKHCHDCGRCVLRMDHHCWWLGNCVGERTHRLFLFYLEAQTALLWWSCGSALAATVRDGQGQEGGLLPPPLALACGVLCALVTLLIGLAALTLLVFQSVLIVRGETTWEHLRREQLNAAAQLPPQLRPYDRGPLRNVLGFCGCACGPPAGSRIAPRPDTGGRPDVSVSD